jgi:hypothetical protein
MKFKIRLATLMVVVALLCTGCSKGADKGAAANPGGVDAKGRVTDSTSAYGPKGAAGQPGRAPASSSNVGPSGGAGSS